jgi:hypothetical protein
MKTIIRIPALQKNEFGEKIYNDLVSIYPEGQRTPHSFWCILPEDDPKINMVLARLAKAGLKPWEDRSREISKGKEFYIQLLREYDDSDYSSFEYLEVHSIPCEWSDYRDEETGLVKLDIHQVDNSVDIARVNWERYAVPDRVKRALEAETLKHVCFKPVLLCDSKQKKDHISKILPWRDWGPPWWELCSDYMLGPVSPRMNLMDYRRQPIAPGIENEPYTRSEGLYLYPELHYLASGMAKEEPFDLARTRESFGGDLRWNERTLVASQGFYQACKRHGFKTKWLPVRIDPD